MTIHVLYDDRKPERLDNVMEEFRRQNISNNVKIWGAIIKNNISIVESINAGHKNIVQYAKDNNLPEICIAEDDLMFPNENGWNYFIENKPDLFDLYIGGNYLCDNRIEKKPPLLKVSEYVGNQLIIISKKYYDVFLSVPNNQHIDTAQKGLGEFYVCYPFVALQRPGRSANNNNEIVDYNKILDISDIY